VHHPPSRAGTCPTDAGSHAVPPFADTPTPMSPLPSPERQNRPLLGILFMCTATSLFPVMNGLVQVLSARYSSEQLVWARIVMQVVFILAIFGPRAGVAIVRTREPGWQMLRSVAQLASTFLFFSGVKYLPLAKAASISFTGPFIVALLAWPILGERMPLRRVLAIVTAFVGVLIVIRPGSEVFHWASFFILGSAFCYATYQIATRRVAGHDPAETSAFYGAVAGAIVMSAVVPFFWRPIQSWLDLFLIMMLGLLGGLGHYFVARAMLYAQANIISPFGYWQMVGAVIVGYVVSGRFPDLGTWIGAGIIIAAGLYMAWSETRAAPRRSIGKA
jgi:drug/metabolite transporter (DMT)-like permease